jgi:hypothetical protein
MLIDEQTANTYEKVPRAEERGVNRDSQSARKQ